MKNRKLLSVILCLASLDVGAACKNINSFDGRWVASISSSTSLSLYCTYTMLNGKITEGTCRPPFPAINPPFSISGYLVLEGRATCEFESYFTYESGKMIVVYGSMNKAKNTMIGNTGSHSENPEVFDSGVFSAVKN